MRAVAGIVQDESMAHRSFTLRFALIVSTAIAGTIISIPAQEDPYRGRWQLTGIGENAGVYWLEITDDHGQLTGRFLNRGGSPVTLAAVRIENGELFFQGPPPQRGSAPECRARLKGDRLARTIKTAPRPIEFAGLRPPKWPAPHAHPGRPAGAA